MSKIEADKFELSYTEFHFQTMLKRVTDVLEFRLAEKKQRLEVSVDENIPPHIISDEQRLAQVITNLLVNSVKFTPEGGRISIAAKYLGEGTIEICVADTGIGISAEQQKKLFQSFVQVDSSISRKYGGTGLGLAISRRIVEMMNGTIRIESDTGKGAAFIFTITAEIPKTGTAEAEAEGDAAGDAGIDFTGRHILLVEDVDINREIVVTVLEPTGLAIDEAEDGQAAFNIYTANPARFDLVFMDIHMPGVDGYESTRMIRAWEAEQNALRAEGPRELHVPIIAMTANVFREDIERCLAAGMNAHIGKPVNFDEVMAILREYLAKPAAES
jgi:CheY-like chemotaxis protein